MDLVYHCLKPSNISGVLDEEVIKFLLPCSIGNLEDMEHHGLKLNDLSMYDSSRDMVLNGWQHASMLEYTIEKVSEKIRPVCFINFVGKRNNNRQHVLCMCRFVTCTFSVKYV